jgi:hypothetical protein
MATYVAAIHVPSQSSVTWAYKKCAESVVGRCCRQDEAESSAAVTEEERSRTAAAARAWQEELEGALRRGTTRDAWPTPVRRLVEERERISAEAAKRELRKEIEDMERCNPTRTCSNNPLFSARPRSVGLGTRDVVVLVLVVSDGWLRPAVVEVC